MANHDSAHHIEEFGTLPQVVHTDDVAEVASGVGSVSAVGKQVRRLRKRLFRKRQLQQHFAGNVLFRTMRPRTVTQGKILIQCTILTISNNVSCLV